MTLAGLRSFLENCYILLEPKTYLCNVEQIYAIRPRKSLVETTSFDNKTMTCLVSAQSWRNNQSYSFVNEAPQLSQRARGPVIYTTPYSSPVFSRKFGIPPPFLKNIPMQLCDARWPGVIHITACFMFTISLCTTCWDLREKNFLWLLSNFTMVELMDIPKYLCT